MDLKFRRSFKCEPLWRSSDWEPTEGRETIIQIILRVTNYEHEMHMEPSHGCVTRNDLYWRCFESQNLKVILLVI